MNKELDEIIEAIEQVKSEAGKHFDNIVLRPKDFEGARVEFHEQFALITGKSPFFELLIEAPPSAEEREGWKSELKKAETGGRLYKYAMNYLETNDKD